MGSNLSSRYYSYYTIGKYTDDDYYFNGLIDEVRISDTARSPAWIKASYNSENDTLLTYGAMESVR